MRLYRTLLTTLFFLGLTLLPAHAFTPESMTEAKRQIENILHDKAATVGVACAVNGQRFTFNDEIRYPLMSVFKLHVAVAVLQRMEAEGVGLDEILSVDSTQMCRDTYSPLLDRYPSGNFRITYADLLRYSLAQSDNNACDILIDYAGGIEAVKACIDRSGIIGYDLTETEASMHADPSGCYRNWGHPSSVVRLLEKIHDGALLNESHTRFMKKTLIETSTGTNKIRAGLPPEITLGHKTGSSGKSADGLTIADNDAGFIYLPYGRVCYLVIFLNDSHESDRNNARIIADIAKIIYNASGSSSPTRQSNR